MRREWELDDLVASWTLVDADLELLASKHGATRLSFGLMVKSFLGAQTARGYARARPDYHPQAVTVAARLLDRA